MSRSSPKEIQRCKDIAAKLVIEPLAQGSVGPASCWAERQRLRKMAKMKHAISETPRTDEVYKTSSINPTRNEYMALYAHAQQLEREVKKWDSEYDDLHKQLVAERKPLAALPNAKLTDHR